MAFTAKVVAQIIARDHNQCALCGDIITGTRGIDWSVHHRCPRGSGGTRRTWVNQAANGVLLHGSGVTRCHGRIESNRDEARDNGFLISAIGNERAHNVPINHAVHGRCLLTDDGLVETGPHVF